MRRGRAAGFGRHGALGLVALGLAVVALGPGVATGERVQRGELIIALDGGISPLRLPRERPAPVALRLEGSLTMADSSPLPRVRRVEIGLPAQGLVSSRGLPACPPRRLRDTKSRGALALCAPALVGRGRLEAQIHLPNQAPFEIEARLLLFNSRLAGGRHAVLLHAYAARPPTSVAIPFAIERRSGRFATVLAADLPRGLGPWPRFARYEMTLWRRYEHRGRRRSFLSASCPVPRRFTAGFLSIARSTYTLAGGRRIAIEIVRGCRARD